MEVWGKWKGECDRSAGMCYVSCEIYGRISKTTGVVSYHSLLLGFSGLGAMEVLTREGVLPSEFSEEKPAEQRR